MSGGELLIHSSSEEFDVYCPGCAEFILHLGVGSRDDILGFEAYCPRCDVALFEHTAIVAEGDVDDDRDDFRDAAVAGWRELVDSGPRVYLAECEYRANLFGWGGDSLDLSGECRRGGDETDKIAGSYEEMDFDSKQKLDKLLKDRHERLDPGPTANLSHAEGEFSISAKTEYDIETASDIVDSAESYKDALSGLRDFPHAELLVWDRGSKIPENAGGGNE